MKKRLVAFSLLSLSLSLPAHALNKNSVLIAASALTAASGLYILSEAHKAPTKKKKAATTLVGLALVGLGITSLIKADQHASAAASACCVKNTVPAPTGVLLPMPIYYKKACDCDSATFCI